MTIVATEVHAWRRMSLMRYAAGHHPLGAAPATPMPAPADNPGAISVDGAVWACVGILMHLAATARLVWVSPAVMAARAAAQVPDALCRACRLHSSTQCRMQASTRALRGCARQPRRLAAGAAGPRHALRPGTPTPPPGRAAHHAGRARARGAVAPVLSPRRHGAARVLGGAAAPHGGGGGAWRRMRGRAARRTAWGSTGPSVGRRAALHGAARGFAWSDARAGNGRRTARHGGDALCFACGPAPAHLSQHPRQTWKRCTLRRYDKGDTVLSPREAQRRLILVVEGVAEYTIEVCWTCPRVCSVPTRTWVAVRSMRGMWRWPPPGTRALEEGRCAERPDSGARRPGCVAGRSPWKSAYRLPSAASSLSLLAHYAAQRSGLSPRPPAHAPRPGAACARQAPRRAARHVVGWRGWPAVERHGV